MIEVWQDTQRAAMFGASKNKSDSAIWGSKGGDSGGRRSSFEGDGLGSHAEERGTESSRQSAARARTEATVRACPAACKSTHSRVTWSSVKQQWAGTPSNVEAAHGRGMGAARVGGAARGAARAGSGEGGGEGSGVGSGEGRASGVCHVRAAHNACGFTVPTCDVRGHAGPAASRDFHFVRVVYTCTVERGCVLYTMQEAVST